MIPFFYTTHVPQTPQESIKYDSEIIQNFEAQYAVYGKNTSPFFLLSFAGTGIDSSQDWKHILKMPISPSVKDRS